MTETRVTMIDQINCVKREIALRKSAYPKWVQSGRMTQVKADQEIAAMEAVLGGLMAATARPRIVCLCGSTRFMDAFREANISETMQGHIVLSVGVNTKEDSDLLKDSQVDFGQTKAHLDELHKRKIDLADEVFVLNVGGYIGESTRSEIAYAHEQGKPVRYLEPLGDGWRNVYEVDQVKEN